MFQRFASTLFGDDVDELRGSSRPGDGNQEEEEDEDWILVNYLAEACSDGSTVGPEEDEEEEDLVVAPSPMASPRIRYASCTSLDSTADTDPEGGAEEDTEEEVEDGFLRVDASSLEESWFVTPPPCFTGGAVPPVLLEPSPLENLLIEHPSMSVYAHHSPHRLTLDPLPRSLDLQLGLLPENLPPTPTAPGGHEKGRRGLDSPRHRPDGAAVQCRSSIAPACYPGALPTHPGALPTHPGALPTHPGALPVHPGALPTHPGALPTHPALLPQRPGNVAQNAQPLSRKALRRLNLLRPPKAGTAHLHQPSQRHLNF